LTPLARSGYSCFVIARRPEADEAISGMLRFSRNRLHNLKNVSMNRQYYVYIMTNKRNTVLYTGITNDLKRRAYEHKEKLVDGFTKKYNITKLVYYEVFADPENAILREKQIKAGSRQKKIDLINSINREWLDLYEKI
jgi:putative endonuclease